jgi:hypothetical protein
MYPVCSVIRQPIFDPFNAVIGSTGEVGTGPGSWAPPGTALYQTAPASAVYSFDVGQVPSKPVPASGVNTWVFANAMPVLDTGTIVVDLTNIPASGIIGITASAPLAPVPDGRLFGYAFLSPTKEQ